MVDAGTAEPGLTAALTGQGFEVRAVETSAQSDPLDDFTPDLLVIDLRHSDPVVVIREATRMLAAGGMGVNEAELAVRTRRLLAEIGVDGVLQHGDVIVD